jgi:hypothetical protein
MFPFSLGMSSHQDGKEIGFITSESKILSEWLDDRLDLMRDQDRWRDARALVKEFFVAGPEKP